jgi:hypothetical protein
VKLLYQMASGAWGGSPSAFRAVATDLQSFTGRSWAAAFVEELGDPNAIADAHSFGPIHELCGTGCYGTFMIRAGGVPGPPIAGDLNGDGVVDVFDLLILLGAWGICPAAEPGSDGSCPADLTGDGVVDVLDLLALLANWS